MSIFDSFDIFEGAEDAQKVPKMSKVIINLDVDIFDILAATQHPQWRET